MPVIVTTVQRAQPLILTPSSARIRVVLDTGDEVITEQFHKDDCDIHTILRRFVATGVLPTLDKSAYYGDFSNVQSYQEAQTLIARINSYFESLPARLRERFGNSPSKFIDFVNDSENRKECEELGIFKKDPIGSTITRESAGSSSISGDGSSEDKINSVVEDTAV